MNHRNFTPVKIKYDMNIKTLSKIERAILSYYFLRDACAQPLGRLLKRGYLSEKYRLSSDLTFNNLFVKLKVKEYWKALHHKNMLVGYNNTGLSFKGLKYMREGGLHNPLPKWIMQRGIVIRKVQDEP